MKTKGLQVFLIDDDEDDFIMIRDLFREVKEIKCELQWESSYKKALEILETQTHDIYLIDYRLGEQTGLDLLDEANLRGWLKPMILLTGYGDHHVDMEAMKRGAADYLVKSEINVPLLGRSVRYAIKRYEDLSMLREREAQIIMQDRLASIGLLASGLAHEIGTPLGVIRGRAEILNKQLKDQTLANNANIIVTQIDRISVLIKSLLNLARGNQSPGVATVYLTQVVTDVLELLSHEVSKNKVQVINNVKSSELMVKANSGELHQVLLNLLVNSIHAIESANKEGRSENHFIKIDVKDEGKQIILNIQDSGCGITKENIKNLFKPFFTTKDVGVGTGLGLATSYRIVTAWGGDIKVESQHGQGSTFQLILPKK
jgi:signal transduction histidine kinase